MTSKPTDQKRVPGAGQGTLLVLVLGAVLGYFAAGGDLTAPLMKLVAAFSLGTAGACVLVQWEQILADALALLRDPVPAALDVAQREAVKEHLAKLTGGGRVRARARHLLQAWSQEGSPQPVMLMARFQSQHARAASYAGSAAALVLLATALLADKDPARPWLAWAGVSILALTFFVRQNVLSRMDTYVEARLLARLPANIPQTAITAADLAASLGGAIENAFRLHVPQPDDMAGAMRTAVAGVVKDVGAEVEKLEKTLVQGQSSLVEKWMHTAAATTADLKDVEKAIGSVVTDLTGGLSSNAEKLKTMLTGHTKDIDRIMTTAADQMKAGVGGNAEKLSTALQEHSARLDKAIKEIGSELRLSYGECIDKLQIALSRHAEQIGGAGGSWGADLRAAFTEHAQHLKDANQGLAEQLSQAADGLKAGVGGNAERLSNALQEHSARLDKAIKEIGSEMRLAYGECIDKLQASLSRHAEQIGGAGGSWGADLKAVFVEHAGNIQAASQNLAEQLSQIARLEQDIEKVLHVQEAVEGAVRGLATTKEFNATLAALRKHIEESDKLLTEVSKPRIIRLVESEKEAAEEETAQ